MSKKSSTDAAAFNGELHGELYSPDYAVHINTEGKLGKEEKGEGQQGELYSSGSAMQTSFSSQQNKQDSEKT
ncbi:hypothetical protein PHJA_002394900 [Phtheirospermum japonicum]|uniref:Uncharacterized protein n=1 Tax=Phtheirospermum japonicum TaxID=374723 RepID=A0A830CY58_9LAMI|nr:hypothetical protein PHJA_002394900 [Phtheirospermum japonicum]